MRERRSSGEYPRRKCDCDRSMLAATDMMDERTKIRATEKEEVMVSSSSTKRRKVDDSDEELLILHLVENSASASTADSTMSSSSLFVEEWSDVKKENMRSTDLEHKESATEIGTVNICQSSKETSPATSDLSAQFMESSSSATTKKQFSPMNSRRTRPSAAEMPSSAEIEEFFSAAEKCEQKRFLEKYNYDIVKDVPLEGRYHWVRLKP